MKIKIVKVLIDHSVEVNAEDNMGNTPLLAALRNKDLMELLIKWGANINHTNKDEMYALTMAVKNMNEEAMSILFKYEADVNILSTTQDKYRSAMSILLNKWFISLESQSMAITLLQHGANAKYVRSDTIHTIIASNNRSLVQGLIVSGLCPTYNGNTPLLICAQKGMSDIVGILLTKGADVNAY